jgi:nitroimidazol reductase NimA-like FMN-containing flavoprotein (pyridoxamine 5'-phosphate oxidase superfamily)
VNRYLQERVYQRLAQHQTVTLATCGKAGPQVQRVPYALADKQLHLFVAQTSDHLFNLETQPELVLLSPDWKLHGRGVICQDCKIAPPHPWQRVVIVTPDRLHILSDDSQHTIETIDF